MAEMYQELLKVNGVNAFGFQYPDDALKWLDENDATLLLVDLALSIEIDGLTLIQIIREIPRHKRTTIWVISGQELDSIVKRVAGNSHVDRFFSKSEHFSEIVDAVKERVK